MVSFSGYKKLQRDCNELKMLIHPGLVQVHEATKTRNSKSAYPLITIFSTISQHFSCILSQITDNSNGKMLLQIKSALWSLSPGALLQFLQQPEIHR